LNNSICLNTPREFIPEFPEFTWLCGAPVIMSNIPPYNTEVKHNESALLCKKKEEWLFELGQVIDLSQKIEELANPAFTNVIKYNINLRDNMKWVETVFII